MPSGSVAAPRLSGAVDDPNHTPKRDKLEHQIADVVATKVVEELPGLEVVGEVGDGPSLFAALARTRPDCLLIDVTMPDFKPIQAIGKIRAQYPSLKILVVSAFDDDIYVQGLLGAGVNGYHLKDQPLSDLQLAVQRVLAGELWVGCLPWSSERPRTVSPRVRRAW